MAESDNGLFDGEVCYKNLRVCRCLCAMFRIYHADTDDDWSKWRTMSPPVKKAIVNSGLWTYAQAVMSKMSMMAKMSKMSKMSTMSKMSKMSKMS